MAILHNQSHLIPVLIELGADVNAVDEEKLCNPVIMTAILQDEWGMRQLINAGADVHKLSREGRSAMYIAVEKGHSGIIRLLVERCGVDVNAVTTMENHRGSPLHIAAMFDNIHTACQLIKLGADIYKYDALNRRPIDVAREASSYGVLYMLASHMNSINPREPITLRDNTDIVLNSMMVQDEGYNSDDDAFGIGQGSLTYLLTHSRTHSLAHSLTHSLTHSITHLLTHLLTLSLGGLKYDIWPRSAGANVEDGEMPSLTSTAKMDTTESDTEEVGVATATTTATTAAVVATGDMDIR